MASVPDSKRLRKEASQWKLTQRLLLRLKQSTEGFRAEEHRNSSVRMENTLGRWLSTMIFYEWRQMEHRYPLYPSQPLSCIRSKAELKRLLRERFTDIDEDQAMELVEEQLQMIDLFLSDDQQESTDTPGIHVQFEYDDDGGYIEVGEFRSPHCHRIQFLVNEYGLMETALVSLRYDSLNLFTGGESGLSVTTFNALHDIGKATCEGFASPLNCRLLGQPDTKFCSLFEDTDSAFGSLGNFFSINLTDHPGGWILNPPFVEPVLEATARKVVDHLQEAEPGSIWFYVTFPRWEDNESWQVLNQCEWKVARLDFKSNKFINQDCYGFLLWPQYCISMFILGQLPEDVDLMELRNQMSCKKEAKVEEDWLKRCT